MWSERGQRLRIDVSSCAMSWIFQSTNLSLLNSTSHKPDPPKNVQKPQIDVIVMDMVYFSFVCLLKLILYNSKPQNQMCDWNQKCFFTFLVDLAYGAPVQLTRELLLSNAHSLSSNESNLYLLLWMVIYLRFEHSISVGAFINQKLESLKN